MTTITLANRSVRVPNAFYGVVLALILVTLSVNFLGLPAVQAPGAPDANLGAWERAYFLDGSKAPVFVDTGVNASITQLARINARVATYRCPGDELNGNSERLMFGIAYGGTSRAFGLCAKY